MGKWELNMNPVQEWGEELEHGVLYGVTLRREPVAPPSEPATEPCAFSFVQYRTCKVRRVKAASLERLVSHLLESHGQEQDDARIFLATYRSFTTTQRLVKLLFQRADAVAGAEGSDALQSSLLHLTQTLLEEHAEDFCEPPNHPSLQLLSSYLHCHPPFQCLAQCADDLLQKFLDEEKCVLTPETEHTRALQQEEDKPEGEGLECEDLEAFMSLSALDIAEQLTRMDAELFVKVIPFQCLGCVWSRREKKENPCPTVKATIAQFNGTTNRVITSVLCCTGTCSPGSRSPPPGPAQRARIIEKWIRVAQECRHLYNFSSLRAILSALQSNAIYRLKKTWSNVCRESGSTFSNLCETFLDDNCVLGSGYTAAEDGSQPDTQNSSPKSPKCGPASASKQTSTIRGSVPYLGTYLTVLTMLDTALPDVLEGGLINFEKRRREFEILSQIHQLQALCSQHLLPQHPQISMWLQEHRPLSDQESYELSRELEPPVDSCPSSPSPWSHRLKKLSSLLSVNDSSTVKPVVDQISLSSSGSSCSELEGFCSSESLPCGLQGLSSSSQSVSSIVISAPATPCEPSPVNGSPYSSQLDLSWLPPPPHPLAQDPPTCHSAEHIPHHKRSASMNSLPVYNRQVDDSCIVRVSVESNSNGNMYKSILLSSQDKTAQVIQRALEKHNLEGVCCEDFSLYQVLLQDKELLIPDKANVFYAMSTSANYDFILRKHQNNQRKRPLGSSSSFRLLRTDRNDF